jgi:dihydrofolate reductase
MGRVIASASMSLDGFIAKDDNTIGRLFDWYQNGEVEFPTATEDMTFHLSPQSAEHWGRWVSELGALVCGRTLFDVTDGWGGRHTMDVPVVVVTHEVPTDWVEAHPDAPFQFVTDGVEEAVARAQEIAGDRVVAVTAGTVARSSGSCRSRMFRSATQRSVSRETGSPIWCSPRAPGTTSASATPLRWARRLGPRVRLRAEQRSTR